MVRVLALCFFLLYGIFYVSTQECCPCSPTPVCSTGWQGFSGHCYAFVKGQANWYQAKDACIHLGGHLVKIGSAAENDWVRARIEENKLEKPWIGLIQLSGRWQWIDGSNVLFTDWNDSTDEPSGDGNCGQIRDDLDNHWNDEPCYRQNDYVCEKDD